MKAAALTFACFALIGCVQAVTLVLSEGNSTCIKAQLSVSFSITYDTNNGSTSVQVPLPDSASVDEGQSSCGSGGGAAQLWVVFGDGHSLGLSFTSNLTLYGVNNLTLQYNLSDPTLFPQANSSGLVTEFSASPGIWAAVNTTYRCSAPTSVQLDRAVAMFSNVRLEAYMPGDDLSPAESVCAADQTTTAAPPTTSTAAPPPPPSGPPLPGTYSVSNGSVCLLARMGLQFNVSYVSRSQSKVVREAINLTPSLTNASGSCETDRATLTLTEGEHTTLNFTFTLNSTSNKYHLSGLSLFADWPDMTAPLRASNFSLDYLRSSLGRSYMCSAEQTLSVDPNFTLNTFKLQVQPFRVSSQQFDTAEECQMDQDQMLIPIIVGAALAGLVLIVLVAYLIGRRRSHAGYQTI